MIALYLALAAGVAATTITKAKAFQPLRISLKSRNAWAGYLVSCPYCTSHWLVFVLQAIYRVRLLHAGPLALDVVVSSFPLIGVAVLVPAVLTRLYRFTPDRLATSKAWMDGLFPEGHFNEHPLVARAKREGTTV
jgi:hypothetical protein